MSILVLADSDLDASKIAEVVRDRIDQDVVVRSGRWSPSRRDHFVGAITARPLPSTVADTVIELPASFEEPIKITTGDLSVWLAVDEAHPIEDAADALGRLLLPADALTAPTPTA